MNDLHHRDPERDFIRINQILGKQASLGFIPANQILSWTILVIIAYLLTNFFFSLGMAAFAIAAFWLVVSWWLLTGNRPHLFVDRFRRPPGKEWCNGNRLYVPLLPKHRRAPHSRARRFGETSQLKPIIIDKQGGGGRFKFMPFQNEADICSVVEISKKERKVSGLLLKKGNTYQVVFAFRLKGIHDLLYSNEVSAAARNLELGLRELPQGEKFTIYCGCHSLDRVRQSELDATAKTCNLPAIAILIRNEQKRIKELKHSGARQTWEQIAFCTWTANEQVQGRERDWIGKAIDWSKNCWDGLLGALSGNRVEKSQQFYTRLLLKAFESGFIRWEVLLNTKMGMDATPLDTPQLWEWLWYRFNNPAEELPEVPQVLRLEETQNGYELNEQINSHKHIITVLIEGQKGRSACPEHRESCDRVYLTGKGSEIGVLTMFDPPKGWSSTRAQLRWIWDVLSGNAIRDTEAWIELSPASNFLIADNLAKQAKQSKAASQRAGKKGQGRDIGAEIKQSESFEAQARLYGGVQPLQTAIAFLVYRENTESLNNACSVLANSFGSAKVVRERNVAWDIWLQTLPINSKWLLHSSQSLSERRLTLDSITAPGVLGLTVPRDLDRRGIEFLSHEGGKPLHLDILHATSRRALIVGESGSGKSVLGCRFAIEALANKIPVVGMDISSGGDSTFKTFISLLGEDGAYYDISEGSSNLMEPPDLRHFPKKERSYRMDLWKEALKRALLAIAMGKITAPHLMQRVDSILIRMLDVYLRDPEIIKRYNDAFEGGWKSSQWQQMPVVRDLLRFGSRERLDLKNFEDLDKMALNQIHSQFGALLASRLGKAIGRPSTFSPEPAIKFFALSGLANENDAYILAISAHAACIRNALSHPKSLFIGDELSVLFKKEGFANMVGELCATGRKDGISICLISQDYNTICESSAGAQIMQNMTYKLSGRLTHAGVAAAKHYLDYPPRIIAENATESFLPKRSGLYSAWLIESGGRFWRVRYYPGEMTLSCVANAPPEKAARHRVMSQYPDSLVGQLRGLKAFTDAYIPTLKNGGRFDRIGVMNNE